MGIMNATRDAISLDRACELAKAMLDNIEGTLRGKPEVVLQTVICVIARGHLLIEDVPGVGKTTLARATAFSIDADFNRVQFTSDLLPSDLTGISVPEFADGRTTHQFRFQPGPLFANVVLADEINRANPKCQSALLEAMSEQTVSVDGTTHALPDPYFVVATQNPLEHYGTHPLPESQMDRFLMRITIGYPAPEFEAEVLREDPAATALPGLKPVVTLAELREMQELAGRVKFSDELVSYLLEIVEQTRQHEALDLGVSPRGALALRRAAQSRALIDGRDFCIPEDVRDLAVCVLSHRVCASLRGGVRPGDDEPGWILREILDRVPVPL
jgi:MoxR-like ATPase